MVFYLCICSNCCDLYPLKHAPKGVLECAAFYDEYDQTMYFTDILDLNTLCDQGGEIPRPETTLDYPEHRSGQRVVYYFEGCPKCRAELN